MTPEIHPPTLDPVLDARLTAIEDRLDRLLAADAARRDLMAEIGPIAQSMSRAATARFADLDARGYFAFGRHLLAALDRVVGAYDEDDLARFADAAVRITDTVRNLTQPEVLDVLDQATEDPDEPLSMWGAMKATRDPEVQRGLAVVFAVLRGLGREPDAAPAPRKARPQPAERPVTPTRLNTPAEPPSAPPIAAPAERRAAVEGGRFDPDGFLLDPTIWTPELGAQIAAHLGLTLEDDHWRAVNWARRDYLATGASPNVRRVAHGSELGTRALYALFPQQPGKTIARVAGIPKPVGCL